MAGRRDARGAVPVGKDRERLLRLLRLTASDRDGEALSALRRAAALMARLDLDWDALVDGGGRPDEAGLDAVAMAEAFEIGREQGLREGRCAGVREGRAQERLGFAEARQASYAAGLAAGEAAGREAALSQAAEMVRAALAGQALVRRGERPDDEAAPEDVDDVVRRGETIVELLGRPRPRSAARARHQAQIQAILANPHTPARTVSFVASLSRWLDTRGPLTPGQADALERTHGDWGRGAA